MTIIYAILPHESEFAVCHMGTAKMPFSSEYRTVWVVDQVCPNEHAAVMAQIMLVKQAKIREAAVEADLRALGLRR